MGAFAGVEQLQAGYQQNASFIKEYSYIVRTFINQLIMSELRKANTENPYFITLTVMGWIDLFTHKEYCEILLDNLEFCQNKMSLELFEIVIMPSHLHMIARHQEGKLDKLMGSFKSVTAKAIIKEIHETQYESRKDWLIYLLKHYGKKYKQNKEFAFWQKTKHPVELFSNSVIDQKIEYIHNNPVEAGIVTDPAAYTYSSANPFFRLKLMDA